MRKRPHDADEIWKHSFAFTFKPTVHVVRHEKGAFWKHSSNRRNLKTPAFRFKVDGKHFKTMTPLNFLTLDGSKLIKCSLLTWRSFLNQSRSFTASLGYDDKIFERRRLIVHLSNLIRRHAWLGGNLNSVVKANREIREYDKLLRLFVGCFKNVHVRPNLDSRSKTSLRISKIRRYASA